MTPFLIHLCFTYETEKHTYRCFHKGLRSKALNLLKNARLSVIYVTTTKKVSCLVTMAILMCKHFDFAYAQKHILSFIFIFMKEKQAYISKTD